jgi:hypothetical protein
MKLPPDFKDLLAEFAREGVEHAVIGGYAFAYHVEPRATKDLDVLLEASAENRARAARALARYGAPANVVAAVAELRADEVAYFGEPPLRVDLLMGVDGVDTHAVLQNAVSATWDSVAVRVIALEDLIANKRATGRPQDLVDLERLLKAREAKGLR